MSSASCQSLSRKGLNTGLKESQKWLQNFRVWSTLCVFSSVSTCFKMRSNIRIKQLRFISSSSQSKSIAFPLGCPKFLKGLWKGLRIGLRNGLWKGLGKGLSMLCWTLRPGSEATLTWRYKESTSAHDCSAFKQFRCIRKCRKWQKLWQPYYSLL